MNERFVDLNGWQTTWKRINRPQLAAYLALFLLALLSYANTFPSHFFMDDHSIVELNPLVQHFDLVKIFTSDYWGDARNSGLFRPLTILSLTVNRTLFGISANAFHAVNLALHCAIVLLIFPLLQHLQISRRVAWLTAAIFAVHPIHTEVINMAVGRSELLAALFLLLCFWFSAPQPSLSRQRLALVAVAYGGALLSKEHAIVLLAILPLLDWTCNYSSLQTLWQQRRTLYLLLLAETVLWLLWRAFMVVRVVPRDVVEPAINPLIFMEPIPRLLTALQIQGLYLWKLLWPADLRAVYSGTSWFVAPTALASPLGLATVVATLLLVALLIRGIIHRHLSALGLSCTLISLFPTANILLLVGVVMAERLAYFPSLWFALALAALLATIPQPRVFVAASLVIVLALMGTTLLRNRDFSSEGALWRHEVDRDPRNVMAWMALAESSTDKEEAEAYFREKLKLVPDLAEGQSVYAGVLYAIGQYDDEVLAFALRAEDDPRTDLLTNKFLLARTYLRKKNYEEALRWLEKSRPMYGEYGIFWEVRGMAMEGLQRYSEAVDAFRRAAPYSTESEVPMHLGNLLMSQGRYAEAEGVYRQGIALRPRADLWNGLGVALALQGKGALAREAFSEAVRLEPASAKYRENYQRALEGGE